MQVVPTCVTYIQHQTATVQCPSGYAFAMTRTQGILTLPDATQAAVETLTIRY
jgi:hypothetical protein